MDDDERTEQSEEMNEENDAREEDIVEDTDADTKDVEENDNENDSEILRRLDALEQMITRVSGGLDALRESQSVLVENGATIMEESAPEEMDLGVDAFVSPYDLDLLV